MEGEQCEEQGRCGDCAGSEVGSAEAAAADRAARRGAGRVPRTDCVRVARMMISVRSGVTRTSTPE